MNITTEPAPNKMTTNETTEGCRRAENRTNNGKKQTRRRYCLLFFAFLYTFFFAGAYFGWGPMQLLLEENGSYASKCTADEREQGEICPAQSAALVRIHFAGTVSQFISPFLGEVVDRYGPAFLSYLMALCGCSGVALLIVAAQTNQEWILFTAFLAIAVSTWMVRLFGI